MRSHHSSEQAQPWWADVAHLRDAAPGSAQPRQAPVAPRATAPAVQREADPHPRSRTRHARPAAASSRRSGGRRSGAAARPDWFSEATADGRVRRPEQPERQRPRARLVDVAPDHAALSRPVQVRREPGGRPTVTITGRPEAALPPRPAQPRQLPARRARETASSLIASPDRMILWAVALGILMILASLGTASADAATLF